MFWTLFLKFDYWSYIFHKLKEKNISPCQSLYLPPWRNIKPLAYKNKIDDKFYIGTWLIWTCRCFYYYVTTPWYLQQSDRKSYYAVSDTTISKPSNATFLSLFTNFYFVDTLIQYTYNNHNLIFIDTHSFLVCSILILFLLLFLPSLNRVNIWNRLRWSKI